MSQQQTAQGEQAAEATAETGTDPAVVVAGAAALISLHQFFLRNNHDMGLFMAAWPPTILAFASYFSQTEKSDRLQEAL